MKTSKFLLLISALVLSHSATALTNSLGDDWFKPFQWEAFISQSAIYTSDYDYLSRSDDRLSFDMWEAGLLFSTKVKGDLSFSAQILGRRVSEFSDEDIRVDYGFLSHPLYQTQQGAIGVRVGRIRSSYGFYNETRDIPHTRTGIVMPQVLYFDMTRNSFYSADGIEIFGYQDFGSQRLSLQLFVSKPITDQDESEGTLGGVLDATKISGDKSFLAKMSYGSEFEGWRAAFTYYRPDYDAEVEITTGIPPFLVTIQENNASFYSENMVTSLEYNTFNWTLTAEYLRHKFHTDIPVLGTLPLLGLESENDLYEQAFYVQGLYRFNVHWDAYIRFERTKARNISSPRSRFEDTNIGVTYRPDDNWLIRAEAHYVEGLSRLFVRDNDLDEDSHPYWNALLFQVAYKW